MQHHMRLLLTWEILGFAWTLSRRLADTVGSAHLIMVESQPPRSIADTVGLEIAGCYGCYLADSIGWTSP